MSMMCGNTDPRCKRYRCEGAVMPPGMFSECIQSYLIGLELASCPELLEFSPREVKYISYVRWDLSHARWDWCSVRATKVILTPWILLYWYWNITHRWLSLLDKFQESVPRCAVFCSVSTVSRRTRTVVKFVGAEIPTRFARWVLDECPFLT